MKYFKRTARDIIDKRNEITNAAHKEAIDSLNELQDSIRTCPECGKRFFQKTAREKKFCCSKHRNNYNSKAKYAEEKRLGTSSPMTPRKDVGELPCARKVKQG